MTALQSAIRAAIQPAIRGVMSGAGGTTVWTPLTLFAASEVGVWYDPSDFSTLFQDSAGTTPVTAVGDPVGKILDKSGRGNHATQATAASRPRLGRTPVGGRRNLLLVTDTLSSQSVNVRAAPNTLSFTGTGTVTLSGASTAGPLVGTGVSDRVSLTFTPTAALLTLTVSGSVTFAQLEVSSTATAYQKVTAVYDVTEAGVADCYGLYFDGADDFLATAAIDFSGTDKVGVFCGLSRSTYVATEVMVELSTSATANNAAFILYGRSANPDLFSLFGSKGTIRVNATSGAYGLRAPAVITGLGDISGDSSIVRLNGTATTASGDQGTGNYGNYALYIGARAGPTLPFVGFMYSLTVLGRTATAGEITSAESYVAGKGGVTL